MKGIIYKIVNASNQKIYIGQTRQKLKSRWTSHCSMAFNPKCRQYDCHLYRAIRKYGIEKFTITSVAEIIANSVFEIKNLLDDLEIQKIQEYNSYMNGYNSTLGGDTGSLGYKWTEEQKQRGSKAQKGKTLSIETKKKIGDAERGELNHNFGKFGKEHPVSKIVLQYNKKGIFISEWESLSSAEIKTGISITGISACCKGKVKSAGNYVWRYKDDPHKLEVNPDEQYGGRKVFQFTKDDKFIQEFSSIMDASKNVNILHTSIGNCLSERSKSAGGYKWKYYR